MNEPVCVPINYLPKQTVGQIWNRGYSLLVTEPKFHDDVLQCGLFKFTVPGFPQNLNRSMSFPLGNINFHISLIISLLVPMCLLFVKLLLVIKPPGSTILLFKSFVFIIFFYICKRVSQFSFFFFKVIYLI